MRATRILSPPTRPILVLFAVVRIALGAIFVAAPGSPPALLGLLAARGRVR
jgi:hypothetical protein